MRPEERRQLWIERERSWALWIHGAAARPSIVRLMAAVSRLSDGLMWYAIIVLLPWLGGPNGFACALRMVGVGVLNLIIYKVVKRHFARARPYKTCPGIRACVRSLDEYSFPSGHAMHATAFGVMLSAYYPPFALALWSFTLLVALSRVVLGLHYPSDVAFGVAIGLITADLAQSLF